MTSIVVLRGHLFHDRIMLKNKASGYFYCHEPSCPFCIRLTFINNGDDSFPTVDKVIFPAHCHAFVSQSRVDNRAFIERELEIISQKGPESKLLQEKHDRWLVEAKKAGEKMMDDLDYKTGFDDYTVQHLAVTGSQLRKFTGKKMNTRAASMARLRALQKSTRSQTSPTSSK